MKHFLIGVIALLLLVSVGAAKGDGVTVVHEETIQVGPYKVTVGFDEWPPKAERSFDMIFTPVDGIAGKSGKVTLIAPNGAEAGYKLARHPRMHEVWGIDLIALPQAGPWTLQFEINGPQGPGIGRLSPVTLDERPGPPAALAWAIGLLPIVFIVALFVIGWRATRPRRQAETWSWA